MERREATTFVRALLGLALIAATLALAVYVAVTRHAGIPPLLLPFLPLATGLGAWAGAWIIRAAYRDATRPQ